VAKNTTINIRVNAEVKEQVGEILDTMGLSFSDAFNLLIHQIRIHHRLPFPIVAHNRTLRAETMALIERIENGEEEMAGPFDTFEEYKAWLDEEEDNSHV